MFDSNRRKYPRANYPCQLTIWLANGSNDTILANTSNIGAGGLCVHLNQGIDLGTKADIQLHFTNPTTPFKCQGVVVRSKKESDKFYNIGIEFQPLSELKQAFIDGKISELIDLEQKGKS
jgi:c-di-GMP-binding flagellar brake protein YcgR